MDDAEGGSMSFEMESEFADNDLFTGLGHAAAPELDAPPTPLGAVHIGGATSSQAAAPPNNPEADADESVDGDGAGEDLHGELKMRRLFPGADTTTLEFDDMFSGLPGSNGPADARALRRFHEHPGHEGRPPDSGSQLQYDVGHRHGTSCGWCSGYVPVTPRGHVRPRARTSTVDCGRRPIPAMPPQDGVRLHKFRCLSAVTGLSTGSDFRTSQGPLASSN